MTNKDITFGDDAMKRIKAGVDKLANVVKSTLGPGGTNVIIQLGDHQHITKDGVSVAAHIKLDDPIEDLGAQIVKKVSLKTVREAGDGTTTATVLAQAIFAEGLKRTQDGIKPIEVKRGIDRAVVDVVKELKAMSTPVKAEDLTKIATISANGDKVIGDLVGEAIGKVGLEGLVTVEESKSLDTYLKKVDGMRWDRGFMSPHFITNPGKSECELIDPVILIYDGPIGSLREIMGSEKDTTNNIIHRYRQGPKNPELHGKPLVIIAHDFGAEIIATMAVNHTNKAIQCVLIQAPDFKDTRKAILYDIAAMTGATVISKESGISWTAVMPEHLGRCESIRVTQWNSTIVGGQGGLKAINRANEIREQMKEANDHALEVLNTRLARLVNGLMVIYVGGASDVEVREKIDRLDDALNATRAAIEEGVLPGGGVAYVRVLEKLAIGDMGAKILYKAMQVPFECIAENVGEDVLKAMATIIDSENPNFGFNAATMVYEDLIDAGVIDPTKVVRLALENGASVAGMLLTTKAVVSEKR